MKFVSWWRGALIWCPSLAMASSFVGNGGNAGDIELAVALRQTQKTFEGFAGDSARGEPCVCTSELHRHAVCEPLEGLSDEERAYCGRFLRMKSSSISELLSTKNRIRFEWTHQEITVREGGRTRAADAVSHPGENVMTLNQKRFLELAPIERVFLLSHEILHFVSLGEGTLSDEGPQGPYKGPEGGRRFINAVASAAAVSAQETKVLSREGAPLKRSRSDRPWWVSLTMGSSRLESSSSNLAQDRLRDVTLEGRYDFGGWGVFLESHHGGEVRSLYSQTEAREARQSYSVGAFARLHPFKDPLTYWGQSHVLLSLGVAHTTGEYELKDDFVKTFDKSSSTGWSADCQYYIPLRWGLWAFARIGYFDTGIRYSQPRLDQKTMVRQGVGVAYGF